MDIFPKSELRTLVEAQTVGCISVTIYIPTFRPGRAEVQQNPTRLKNLLRQAHERLMENGLRRPDADAYLKPAQRLLEDTYFWAATGDGLVIFLSKDYFRYYRLPIQFEERLVVADRFHVKPLLPMLALDGRFYVMAISQKTVRLFVCTRFSFNELDISGKIPRSRAEALQFDDLDREFQFHAHHAVSGIDSGTVSGHGEVVEDTKDNLLRFFFLVDRGLQREFLHAETAPLVIASVDYLFPIYQKANTYDNLLSNPVVMNPDKLSPLELHKHAISAVEPYFKKREEEAARMYREFAQPKRSTSILDEIVSDSYLGKIYILFVAANLQKWGNYDPFENKVDIHSKEEPCDVDLLDFAAAHTLAHRGEVFVVDADKVPDGGPAAAVLRY